MGLICEARPGPPAAHGHGRLRLALEVGVRTWCMEDNIKHKREGRVPTAPRLALGQTRGEPGPCELYRPRGEWEWGDLYKVYGLVGPLLISAGPEVAATGLWGWRVGSPPCLFFRGALFPSGAAAGLEVHARRSSDQLVSRPGCCSLIPSGGEVEPGYRTAVQVVVGRPAGSHSSTGGLWTVERRAQPLLAISSRWWVGGSEWACTGIAGPV
ncbi:hypothetical protein NDU88_000322 [Pleurodeles waltl]|uniref:Uncharacterized protein n=1 Tax=Pleurodeles waltl TaxID=8319 RepID=A0AAV7S775_PLEWA|nr:hypothetical protein NDU88_000322 [Pleurodeles waltl]